MGGLTAHKVLNMLRPRQIEDIKELCECLVVDHSDFIADYMRDYDTPEEKEEFCKQLLKAVEKELYKLKDLLEEEYEKEDKIWTNLKNMSLM